MTRGCTFVDKGWGLSECILQAIDNEGKKLKQCKKKITSQSSKKSNKQ